MINFFSKKNKECPICENKFKAYLPIDKNFENKLINSGYKYYGMNEHFNPKEYLCPFCQSTDRDRLYASYLSRLITEEYKRECKLLHIAPAKKLNKMLIEKFHYLKVTTFDLAMDGVDVYGNVENLIFEDEVFDIVIFSHVLEHVENPNMALSEIYRVLKVGGQAIIMAPIISDLDKTLEDPTVISEQDRLKNYGQEDHLRLYAKIDFINQIKNAKFHLNQLNISYFGASEFMKLGLKESSVLYIGVK